MTARSAVLVFAVVAGMFSGACAPGPSGSSGAAGTPGAAGTAATGGSGGQAGASCPNVTACGGDVVGTWTVMSSCLTMSGNLDLTLVSADCAPAPVTGQLMVSGSWSAKADGTYIDDTITTGTEHFTMAPSCLVISSTPVTCSGAAGLLTGLGYESVNCTNIAGGGCDCSATVHQSGGMALVSPSPSTSGNFTRSGNVLTLSGDFADGHYSYCATADVITLTPQTTNGTITGTIVLQKRGGTGTGGTTGGGGTTGAAGRGGSGAAAGTGDAGTGGISGAGGSGGAAGAAGAGGRGGGTAGAGGRGGGGGTAGAGGRGGSAGTTGTGGGGTTGAGGTGGSGSVIGPCDIYKSAGNPCVAAHSTVRALFGGYSGKLYQVRNAAGATKDILTLTPGGAADGPSQDAFCMGTTCVITVLYDQSGKGNDLWYQGSTMVPGSPSSKPATATSESLTLNGHKVYSLYINAGNSYWVDASKSGIALGSQPEAMYMVTSGKHWNSGCCFDYGNSEVGRTADGAGSMDTVNLSGSGEWGSGAGPGPWVKADLEYGVFTDNVNNTHQNPNNPSQTSTYVTAILKNNGTTEWALRGGNAATGPLGTYFKGSLPPGGYSPMKKQGAIVLGSGGDCCKPSGGANLSIGTFYEGCIVTGYPTDATEDMVQMNIVAAGYGK